MILNHSNTQWFVHHVTSTLLPPPTEISRSIERTPKHKSFSWTFRWLWPLDDLTPPLFSAFELNADGPLYITQDATGDQTSCGRGRWLSLLRLRCETHVLLPPRYSEIHPHTWDELFDLVDQ